ncbi:MAG: hypothetical protein ILA29_04250 [Prevotella sp.]|nr:hypothetical protein [Prevotella sp.]
MGVDISLHIEVRKQNQWHLMKVTSPQWEKTEHEYRIFNTEVFNCRYYHFRDFLNEADTHKSRNKNILSEELQPLINEDDFNMGFGVFMFSDIVHYCDTLEKKLLSGIAHAGIYSIKEQLNRIEKKQENPAADLTVEEECERLYEETTPIEQMYEDFMWDYGLLFRFRDTVQALTSFGYTHIDESDVRIFYLVC